MPRDPDDFDHDHSPDWGRMGITPPGQFPSPMGDPTRWGASVPLQAPISGFPGRQILRSGQIIQMQCRDQYPRTFSIVGTLEFPALINALPDGGGNDQWGAALCVTMGVGQNQVQHNFNLRAILAADAPYYWNSDQNLGGLIGLSSPFITPFVIPGAIVANAIAIQLIIGIILTVAPGINLDFRCNLQIGSLAAGQNL